MATIRKVTIELSVEEVAEAVRQYLTAQGVPASAEVTLPVEVKSDLYDYTYHSVKKALITWSEEVRNHEA